jgi:hypothetical protein
MPHSCIAGIVSRWPRLLLENTLHHAGADAELAPDLEDAVAVGLQLQDFRLDFGINPTPPEFRSFRPGARQTGVDPPRIIPRSNSANTPNI